jgi:hypothetical protein
MCFAFLMASIVVKPVNVLYSQKLFLFPPYPQHCCVPWENGSLFVCVSQRQLLSLEEILS